MSMTVEQIYAEALRLPDKSKVFLAEQLVEYLGSHIDHDIEDMHLETVKRRRDEVRFGKVQPVDGEAALAHVRQIVNNPGYWKNRLLTSV